MAVQHEHSWKVAEYCVAIARAAGLVASATSSCSRWRRSSTTSARSSIPDHILRKREPLTEREWEAIKQNPVRGAEMVSRIQGLETIVPWVRHSHERVDGTGYPDGLSGEAIPLACRILHVADAFDAMTSGRPYRRAMTREEALEELRRNAGHAVRPQCVETCSRRTWSCGRRTASPRRWQATSPGGLRRPASDLGRALVSPCCVPCLLWAVRPRAERDRHVLVPDHRRRCRPWT